MTSVPQVAEITNIPNIIQVAAGILMKANGEFLLASRPAGKPWAGWWEFPGGKVEADETAAQALSRELHEELGIVATEIESWLKRTFSYPVTHDSPAKIVQLQFFFVKAWQGELTPKEGQLLSWQQVGEVKVSPVLPANKVVLQALALPAIYAISNMAEMGETLFFAALKLQLQAGLQLIQVREKQLCAAELLKFSQQIIDLARPFQAKVLINGDIALAMKVAADGVHLTGRQLMTLKIKPANLMVAASCHSKDELIKAQILGVDFAVLSPVNTTKSHADATPLGWPLFADCVIEAEIPVYALGGLTMSDLPTALQNGACGIAMQRCAWSG